MLLTQFLLPISASILIVLSSPATAYVASTGLDLSAASLPNHEQLVSHILEKWGAFAEDNPYRQRLEELLASLQGRLNADIPLDNRHSITKRDASSDPISGLINELVNLALQNIEGLIQSQITNIINGTLNNVEEYLLGLTTANSGSTGDLLLDVVKDAVLNTLVNLIKQLQGNVLGQGSSTASNSTASGSGSSDSKSGDASSGTDSGSSGTDGGSTDVGTGDSGLTIIGIIGGVLGLVVNVLSVPIQLIGWILGVVISLLGSIL